MLGDGSPLFYLSAGPMTSRNPLPRLLVTHPVWGRGGAEHDALWLMHALQHDYELTLLARSGWDPQALNRFAETQIEHLHVQRVPFERLLRQPRLGTLAHAWFLRYSRRLARGYRLQITLSGCRDFGRPALHRLTDVHWHPALRVRYPDVPAPSAATRVLHSLGTSLAGSSRRPPTRHDLFVANSYWTAEASGSFCARPISVVYPAVPTTAAPASWSEREPDFVCLGRIAPEKNLGTVIHILENLRPYCPVRLHVAGMPDDAVSARRFEELRGPRAHWIQAHGHLGPGPRRELLARCRFGISACERESFGIATAEMMAAGVIPFVPARGAQPEIVRHDVLVYRHPQEAVQLIRNVMDSPPFQALLHRSVARRAEAFSPAAFSQRIRQIVRGELFLQNRRRAKT